MSFLPPAGDDAGPTLRPGAASRRGLVAGVAAGLLILLLVVGGASLASRATTGTSIGELQPGDCFNLSRGVFGQQANRVRCSVPHTDEVAGTFELPAGRGAPYPGRDRLLEGGKQDCLPLVRTFSGDRPPADADIFVFGPDEAAWEKGERTVVCSLRSPTASPRTGSFRQA